MSNRSASLAMSTSVPKALPRKLDIKRHSPSFLYKPSFNTFACKVDPDQRSFMFAYRNIKLKKNEIILH